MAARSTLLNWPPKVNEHPKVNEQPMVREEPKTKEGGQIEKVEDEKTKIADEVKKEDEDEKKAKLADKGKKEDEKKTKLADEKKTKLADEVKKEDEKKTEPKDEKVDEKKAEVKHEKIDEKKEEGKIKMPGLLSLEELKKAIEKGTPDDEKATLLIMDSVKLIPAADQKSLFQWGSGKRIFQSRSNRLAQTVGQFFELLYKGVKIETKDSLEFVKLEKEAAQGNKDAIYKMASMLSNGADGVEADPVRACEMLANLVEMGHVDAHFLLAWHYEQGKGVKQNEAKSNFLMSRAADLSERTTLAATVPDSATASGSMTASGSATTPGSVGDALGQLLRMRTDGPVHEKKYETRVRTCFLNPMLYVHCAKSAKRIAGLDEGELWLTRHVQLLVLWRMALHIVGLQEQLNGISPADKRIYDLFLEMSRLEEKEREMEIKIKEFNIGQVITDLAMMEVSKPQQVKLLEVAVECNNADALFFMGTNCWSEGPGDEKMARRAVEYFRRASDLGHARATCFLGHANYHGRGAKENKHWAANLYRRADETLGFIDADGLLNMGLMHKTGDGVKKSLLRALGFFTRSHEKSKAVQDDRCANHITEIFEILREGRGTATCSCATALELV